MKKIFVILTVFLMVFVISCSPEDEEILSDGETMTDDTDFNKIDISSFKNSSLDLLENLSIFDCKVLRNTIKNGIHLYGSIW